MPTPLFALVALLTAAPAPDAAPVPAAGLGTWSEPLRVEGTLDGATAKTEVLVYRPKGYGEAGVAKRYPLVIALHGWGHSPDLYRDKGNLALLADRHGLVIAVPDLGKTVYETAFYPESKKRWGAIPGTRFVGEVLLPALRAQLDVSPERAKTAIVGYSTGGRGALLVASAYPEFAFAGSLSGTFELMTLRPKEGEYKIHALIYGPRDRFPERWTRDNGVAPERLAGLGGTALFAGHGLKDKVVRPDQLEALRAALAKTALTHTITTAEAGAHDWAFWNAQSEPLFAALATALGLTTPAPGE